MLLVLAIWTVQPWKRWKERVFWRKASTLQASWSRQCQVRWSVSSWVGRGLCWRQWKSSIAMRQETLAELLQVVWTPTTTRARWASIKQSQTGWTNQQSSTASTSSFWRGARRPHRKWALIGCSYSPLSALITSTWSQPTPQMIESLSLRWDSKLSPRTCARLRIKAFRTSIMGLSNHGSQRCWSTPPRIQTGRQARERTPLPLTICAQRPLALINKRLASWEARRSPQ